MLETTRGIFLHHIPYSDRAVIATVYTEKFGRQTYLVNGIRSKKTSPVINLFQPLFPLNMEVYYKQRRNLQRIKDVRMAVPFSHIPFDIRKSAQAFFIAEILMKCLKEEEANPELFSFLFHAVCMLDIKEKGIANFPVAFLFRLTRYLGVFPQQPGTKAFRFFDLVSASFGLNEPVHQSFMNVELSGKFAELFHTDLAEIEKLTFLNAHRSELIVKLLEYYKIHLDLSGEVKSLAVLKEVLE
ncbi:MAG: DNA repair protein RecO [Mangrovibacterium sp.]|nr:DNA repair protein RecO [Mangrovibacterium sp.]